MMSDQNMSKCRYHPQTKHIYRQHFVCHKQSIVPPMQNKIPIATVTVTMRHLLTFSIISWDRDIFGPNGGWSLTALVIGNMIHVCLTSEIR